MAAGPKVPKAPKAASQRGRRNVGLFDLDTGEVLEGVPVLVPRKDRLEDFLMMMLQKLGSIAQDRELTGETLRVLLYVMSQVEYENWIRISQGDVAEALGMQRQNVQRSMRLLVEKAILEKAGTTLGGSNIYRVSKDVAWRGKVKSYRSAKRGEKPAAKLTVVAGTDTTNKEN